MCILFDAAHSVRSGHLKVAETTSNINHRCVSGDIVHIFFDGSGGQRWRAAHTAERLFSPPKNQILMLTEGQTKLTISADSADEDQNGRQS